MQKVKHFVEVKKIVANTKTVMVYNEDLDPPPPYDILNVFAEADLSSQSSYDSVKYKRAWEFILLFYILGKVQTHAVDHSPLHWIIEKLHLLWR